LPPTWSSAGGSTLLSDEEIQALPAEERASLMKQLNDLAEAEASTSPSPEAENTRRNFLMLMTASAVVLVPWIAFLAITLPPRYVTNSSPVWPLLPGWHGVGIRRLSWPR
jgi:hypothetical protein